MDGGEPYDGLNPEISPGRPSIAGRGTPVNVFEMRTEQTDLDSRLRGFWPRIPRPDEISGLTPRFHPAAADRWQTPVNGFEMLIEQTDLDSRLRGFWPRIPAV